MALIKCRECGKQISETATSCPNCGNEDLPVNRQRAEDEAPMNAFVGIIALGVFIFSAWSLLKSCGA